MKALISAALLLFSQYGLAQQNLDGAWKLAPANGEPQTVRIIEDSYFMQTHFDEKGKQFISTHGGKLEASSSGLKETIEFHTADKNKVGTVNACSYQLNNNQLVITCNGEATTWQRIDDGKAPLAGAWRITARENEGSMVPMRPGPRKTLKILSGTRFQWAAINTETKEFFGTGGGTYTFENGKYTENITFFSRDNTRVGAALTFDGKVDGKQWHHSGKSSKGDPISEIWSRIE